MIFDDEETLYRGKMLSYDEETLYRGKIIDCFYKDCCGIFECVTYDHVHKTVHGIFTHDIYDKETHEVIEESIDTHMHIDDLSRSNGVCYEWLWYDYLQFHIGMGTVIRLLDNRHFTCESFDEYEQKVYGIITDMDGSFETAELELHEIEKWTDPSYAFYEIKMPYVIKLIWDWNVNDRTEDIIGWAPYHTEIECIRRYLKNIGGENMRIGSISENTDKIIGEINSYSEKKEISSETKNDIIKNEETEF